MYFSIDPSVAATSSYNATVKVSYYDSGTGTVQVLPSEQLVPSAALGFEHWPVAGSQTPTTWHWSSRPGPATARSSIRGGASGPR